MLRILSLSLCFFWAELPMSGAEHAITFPSSNEVAFQLHHGFLIVVPVQLGSLPVMHFALDTGTTKSALDKRIARKFGIHGLPSDTLSVNKHLKVESAEFPELQFGNIRATNIRLLIFDLASVTEFADGLDGILGLDVLADSRISIDYSTKKLVIEQVRSTSRDLAKQMDTVCTTATANINGVSFHLIVDTGMPGVLLYGSRVRERLPSSQTSNARLVRVGNEMLAGELMLDKIMIGNEEIKNVSALVVSSAPVGLPPTIDGIIGTHTLRARRLTLDLGHNTLQWEH